MLFFTVISFSIIGQYIPSSSQGTKSKFTVTCREDCRNIRIELSVSGDADLYAR